MVEIQNVLTHESARHIQRSFQPIGGVDASQNAQSVQMNIPQKPQLNQMAQEFTPHSVAKKQQLFQQQQQQQQQQQLAAAQGYPAGFPVNQQAALQAAMMNPTTLQAMLQNQNPHFLHHIQQQQLQQLQQLHQQNLRLAAAFNQNQMGIFNATSALMQQMPLNNQNSRGKTVAEETNNDFEHFPTREDASPSPPLADGCQSKKIKSKKKDQDSAFESPSSPTGFSDDSSDSNGSSYITMELEDSEIPENDVLEQICRQVEEYLSDDYLATDKYLLRQLRSKSEGYLSVKLLTSFKKIKKLTRDWRVTAHALKLSGVVELSNDGHRVKRKANLPENLRRGRTMTSILAIRVPDDWATLEAITNIFSAYGNITLARVLRPGRAIPPDLRNYATQIPDMGATTCAVVDFDSTDSAHECCRGLRDKNLRGMRIALLGPRIRRTLYKAEKKKIPENRHQRRINAVHQQKNVSKEEGLKIIQTYFHNQVKPTPDDPIDFPPLHATAGGGGGGVGGNFHPFEHMTNQMHNMTLASKCIAGPNVAKWPHNGPPMSAHAKPTMSQIVAQNNHSHQMHHHQQQQQHHHQQQQQGVAIGDHGDILSDHSSESGLSSPKPANCPPVKSGGVKQFKGWNLNTEQAEFKSEHTFNSEAGDGSGWCPWSTTNFTAPTTAMPQNNNNSNNIGQNTGNNHVEGGDSSGQKTSDEDEWIKRDLEKPRLQTPIDFTFEPLPSLAIGQGIWSNNSNGSKSGW